MRNAEQRSEGACRAALARALAPSQIGRVLRAENDMRASLVPAAILVAGAVACGGKEPTGGGTSPDVAGAGAYFGKGSDGGGGVGSGEGRVGEEGRSWGVPDYLKKKIKDRDDGGLV